MAPAHQGAFLREFLRIRNWIRNYKENKWKSSENSWRTCEDLWEENEVKVDKEKVEFQKEVIDYYWPFITSAVSVEVLDVVLRYYRLFH